MAGSRARWWWVAALGGIVVLLAALRALGPSDPAAKRVAPPVAVVPEAAPPERAEVPPQPAGVSRARAAPAAPSHRIAEGGRLSIDAAALRDGERLAVGLALSDEARGSEPLEVRVVSVDGRRLETRAVPAAGSASGLRLEFDPLWLTPGLYMIQLSTAEKTHFPMRRYVLDVSGAQAGEMP